MSTKNSCIGIVLVALGASSYGMLATFVKLAYQENFTTAEVTSAQVIILEKTMSCNCTHLKTSLDTIQPNEITYLNVKIDTKDKKPGKGEATITVKTNGSRKFYLLEVTFDLIE